MLREKTKGIKCKIKLSPNGQVPTKESENSACYDMYAREIESTDDPDLIKVYLGVHLEPQSGYRVAIYPRSGISKTGWILANCIGIGDNDYRGEYIAYFRRINNKVKITPDYVVFQDNTQYGKTINSIQEFPYKRSKLPTHAKPWDGL